MRMYMCMDMYSVRVGTLEGRSSVTDRSFALFFIAGGQVQVNGKGMQSPRSMMPLSSKKKKSQTFQLAW